MLHLQRDLRRSRLDLCVLLLYAPGFQSATTFNIQRVRRHDEHVGAVCAAGHRVIHDKRPCVHFSALGEEKPRYNRHCDTDCDYGLTAFILSHNTPFYLISPARFPGRLGTLLPDGHSGEYALTAPSRLEEANTKYQ